jgi:hypothetical protein
MLKMSNMMSKIIFLRTLIFSVTACMELSNEPLPQRYLKWSKPNTSREETKKAIQECGYGNIWGVQDDYTNNGTGGKRGKCMIKKGFKSVE